MIVLSLFNGHGGAACALDKSLGPGNYTLYASEVDKFANKAALATHPATVMLGDVTRLSYRDGWLHGELGDFEVGKVDLLVGGSPCQGFSPAGEGLNFDDPRSRLFFDFLRLLDEVRKVNPRALFMLENVRMKKEWEAIISRYMGVEPLRLDSALVSAQQRKRLYWTNIAGGDIKPPADRGILIKDIREHEVDAKYFVSDRFLDYLARRAASGAFNNGRISLRSDDGKLLAVTSSSHKGRINDNYLLDAPRGTAHLLKNIAADDMKMNALLATSHKGPFANGMTVLEARGRLRRITPREALRAQTVPEHHIDTLLASGISDTQLYRMAGNGWTIDMIEHLFDHLLL